MDLRTECGNRGILYWFLILALLFIGGCASGPDISTQMQSAYLGSKQDITSNEKIAIWVVSKNLTLRMAMEKYIADKFIEEGLQSFSLTRFAQINQPIDWIDLWGLLEDDFDENKTDGILIFWIGKTEREKTYIPGSGGSYLFSLPYQGNRSGYGIYGGSSYREGHYKSWVSMNCHIDFYKVDDLVSDTPPAPYTDSVEVNGKTFYSRQNTIQPIWRANSYTSVI